MSINDIVQECLTKPEKPEFWGEALYHGVDLFLRAYVPAHMQEHTAQTPDRIVRAFQEMVAGYAQDPAEPLRVEFTSDSYDEMVHFRQVRITSTCAHHLAPIIGVAHFAYVPSSKVVGLSKVVRFLRILAKRLQIQEAFCTQAVDIFQDNVKPRGCAIHMRAYHCCAMTRGVLEDSMITETTALRGCFKDNDSTRAEFLAAANKDQRILG